MRPTILLVEDDEIIRELAVDVLSILDAEVLPVSSADEALQVLKRANLVSLVLTDIHMPGQIDGLGLARVVVELWPSLPVIVTSGNLQRRDALPHQAAFLPKPWALDSLLTVVQQLLPEARLKE
ncbi:response regulator [Pseudomonas sp. TWRC1-2]|uniref:response regulator n=1 Tax=unclassified Pseudomonas TaxID=196821 RepID=UPI003CF5158B